ncbi:MAG: GNAT family N-acetyltransferase [Xanthomonadales bacterium]|nr:GNAT family N-acetyltransferase [Xanthomonadales bacterium]NIN59258.1 GNAT family N-acetyltransferase [Xanthomonadales bacterium]NIN74609.1 GNAT family N-acetyltransferase [Xanthomonadales bacterium]NIO12555.1 GNAT family N-acetyltransferase [Xanthomonadales bacterium]NIP11651.1 GNAT family N-acetyltransferase [Xanthomonadales bacterium]
MLEARFFDSINDVDPAQWDALFGDGHPFTRHAFLHALEASGSVSAQTGWQPSHLVLFDAGRALAAMPLYVKAHSWGEFVFDWAWAEAYERHGLSYYPKLVTAVPFSPVEGPRLGLGANEPSGALLEALLEAIRDRVAELGASGWHLLFPERSLTDRLGAQDTAGELLQRRDVQFQWFNHGYRCFEAFLASLRSARRKNIRRERRRIAEQGIVLERRTGEQISAAEWADFYACYRETYHRRSGHAGYLTRDFFQRLLSSAREQLLLVVARRGERIVGSALFLFDRHNLYGRYWGALEEVSCLHFEACFYQGIEFCIERGLRRFDPGTQGEHKLIRGFEPVTTHSCHWIADPEFRRAIGSYLQLERRGRERYRQRAAEFLPYRQG